MTGGDAGDNDAVVVDPDAIAEATDPLDIGAGDAPPGTYALVYSLPAATTMTVGALGTAEFPAGAYAYVGSAFGSNGLGRVDRHRRVAEGSHTVTHWHIDYFGGHDTTSLVGVVAAPRANVECRLATELRDRASASQTVGAGSGAGAGAGSGAGASPHGSGERPLDGFGASDCDCPTHFVGGADPKELRSWAAEAFQRVQR
jgi:Uri superfamily endonuclease